jgi:DNA-binding beta-propeller fold protein YncE
MVSGPSALAFSKHVFVGSFGGSGSGAGQFLSPSSVAVNAETGAVYVSDQGNNRVQEFNASGSTLLGEFNGAAAPTGALSSPGAIAVDNSSDPLDPSRGDVYVADVGHHVVDKFSALGAYEGQITAGAEGVAFGQLYGVAVDPAGVVWVYQRSGEIDSYSDGAANEFIARRSTPFGEGPGFAVDTEDSLYVLREEPVVAKLTSSGEVLSTEVTREASTGVAVDLSSNEVLIDNIQHVSVFSSGGALLGSFGQEAGAEHIQGGRGLAINPVSKTVYVADTAANAVDVFEIPVLPEISGAKASGVSATGVTLSANIAPNGSDTKYRFEYGTSTSYGSSEPVPDGDAGAGTGEILVSVHLSGLSANTTYHWRLVATNEKGATTTTDHTFVYNTTGAGLPDGRAYEMISPVQKNGGTIGNSASMLPQSSEDGSHVWLPALQLAGPVSSGSGFRSEGLVGEVLMFSRGSDGWAMSQIAPSVAQFDSHSLQALNINTGAALFSSPTSSGNDAFYVRKPDGSLVAVGPVSPPTGDVSGVAVFSPDETADFSHIVYQTTTNERWPFDGTSGHWSVMEYSGAANSQPTLVGVSGGKGSTDLISACSTDLGRGATAQSGVLSADGRTVFFTAEHCSSGSGVNAGAPVVADSLNARIDGSQTVPVSARSPLECISEACVDSPQAGARFAGAAADGSKVFFTSTQQLTDSASEDNTSGDSSSGSSEIGGCVRTVGSNGCNLYEYDFNNSSGRNLLAVSAGDTGGGGPRVQGVMAISPDGSRVYFVAKGVLSSVANGDGQTARDGGENLYVFERDAANPAGHTTFIATLSSTRLLEGADSEQWEQSGEIANVTPDGRFLVFTSHAALTTDAVGSAGAAQVYRYDALTGSLARVSIGEGGFNDNGNRGRGNASFVPIESGYRDAGPQREDPTMSHDGSYVFFMSPVALTPRASDEVQIATSPTSGLPVYAQNVYEYHDGHVYLISDGKDTTVFGGGSGVSLIGTDATGSNVVFRTADQLVPRDTDTAPDFYDARVCTESNPCISQVLSATACQEEGCHGSPAGAPMLPGAASSTLSGPGNLVQSLGAKAKIKHRAKPKKRKKHRARRRAGTGRYTGSGKAGGKK